MYRVRTAITNGKGGPAVSTLYFSVIGGLTAQNAAAATRKFWDDIKGVIHNSYTMTVEAEVVEIDTTTGQPTGILPTTTSPVTGTGSGDQLSAASQGLLRLRSGTFIGGREVRGHIFIPGPTETLNDNGVPASSYISSLNTAGAALIADSLSDWEIYSRKNHDQAAVISATCWSQWAVLRSRRD